MPLEFGAKVRRIPVYPAADGYASEGPVAKLASNESAYPPIPEVVEAVTKVLSGVNRYPDPTNSALRTRLSDRYGVPANRIAIGNGSCDILLAPATRCSSPAPRSSTRGRASRSTRTSRPPPAPPRSRSRWTPSTSTT
jgi:histidinol-phosphate aminotransferase